MDALSISQTIFYLVASLILIILGGVLVAAALKLLGILRDAKDVTDGIRFIYDKAKQAADIVFHPSKHRK